MILSTFQRKIIDDIISENVSDIQSFIKNNFKYESIGKQDSHQLLFKDDSVKQEVINKVTEFYKLINMLIKKELIILLDKPNPESKRLEMFFGSPMIFEYRLNQMILKLADKFFISSIDLIEYTKRGYKTLEEQAYEEEKRDRKTAQRITIAIALITIIISTILSLLSNCSNQTNISTNSERSNAVDTVKSIKNIELKDSTK